MLIVNDDLVFKIQKYLFFLIPISFIVGQTAVAIIFFSIILSSIFCLKKSVTYLKVTLFKIMKYKPLFFMSWFTRNS
jgi:hypothetical protein